MLKYPLDTLGFWHSSKSVMETIDRAVRDQVKLELYSEYYDELPSHFCFTKEAVITSHLLKALYGDE